MVPDSAQTVNLPASDSQNCYDTSSSPETTSLPPEDIALVTGVTKTTPHSSLLLPRQ